MENKPKITLDYNNLHALETEYGGFTKATINALGLKWNPPKGWLTAMIGKEISEKQYQLALKGKLVVSKKTLKRRRQGGAAPQPTEWTGPTELEKLLSQ